VYGILASTMKTAAAGVAAKKKGLLGGLFSR
jgi:hypothetical protein